MAIFAATKNRRGRATLKVSRQRMWLKCVTKSTPIESPECPQRGTLLPRTFGTDPEKSYRPHKPCNSNHLCACLQRRKWRYTCTVLSRIEGRRRPRTGPNFISRKEYTMRNLIVKLWKEEEGQDLTEYALLLVLLSLAAVGALGTLATAINGTFTNAAKNLTT